ncbi:patatin-like phospholipase family protein [Prosthecomicrobium pneumaticum]|uniref:Putative acylesterase/phospholipase RssA n=1 Tax=Prosthecomicrobium pneumaticum TaxID=81895 RepID=A0A7W9FKR7_9HYPH|nr:putative acylesterase/phospholipase RssA [Prosthecomicrobium pneumaticum]
MQQIENATRDKRARRLGLAAALGAALALSGCLSAINEPINAPVAATVAPMPASAAIAGLDTSGSTVVGLAFSGGGTRAAAFAYGMMRELEATPLPGGEGSMLDSVRMVSGVSGGSVAAAYFGLNGTRGYRDFRERFLIRDGEASMRTSVMQPTNILRAIGGGVNDRSSFGRWLDKNVFSGARFGQLRRPGAPTVWINATDLYNRTPFLFTYDTFSALCSDLDQLPIAEAVAASAAVPVVFAPIQLAAYGGSCGYKQPGWLVSALNTPNVSSGLKAYARALDSYQDPEKLKFVKLVDGGITDNFGITGFSIARASSQTPYGPLSPSEAVKMRRLVFLVGNAGQTQNADWASSTEQPGLADLVMAVTDTAIDASVREGFDSLRQEMQRWHKQLIDWRCGLPRNEVERLRGSVNGWNCRDVKLFVGEVGFEELDAGERAELQRVPTRLKLPKAQVDLVIAAGREALRRNDAFADALKSLQPVTSGARAPALPAPGGVQAPIEAAAPASAGLDQPIRAGAW